MTLSYFRVFTYGWLLQILLQTIHSQSWTDLPSNFGSGSVGDFVNGMTGDAKTNKFCRMNSSDFISYYNYTPEVRKLINKRGHELTIVRCNSRKPCPRGKKVAILQHGILGSSDDFLTNPPSQGLAYILADRCYDVWLLNNQGNYYSRKNLIDWDFSWDDIAFEDFPLIFNYIQKVTNQQKFYYIGHSQGTSSIMALLSEYPKWNKYFYAVSLMAPIGFVSNQKLTRLIAQLSTPLVNNIPVPFEMLPRTGLGGKVGGAMCKGLSIDVCISLMNLMQGDSDRQQLDKSMIGTYACIFPSGASSCQFQHYGQEIIKHFFGRRLKTPDAVPKNFPLYRITVPMYLHYSTNDLISVVADVERLIPMLNGTTALYHRKILNYNHVDFLEGVQAHKDIYTDILNFFAKYTV